MNKNNNIKILATLGPASMEKSIVQKMDSSGVDIFRVNLSHTKTKDFNGIIEKIRSWTKKPICVDTEGAQIRTGKIKNGFTVIKRNSIISLARADVLGNESCIPLYPVHPEETLKTGDILYIDFNSVAIQIIKIEKQKVLARVLFGGKIGSNKGVNIDRTVKLPALTEKDWKILKLSKKLKLSHFALSFASRKEDVEKLRKFFPYPVFIISKIESRAGLNNLEDICQQSDAILIDRGDLSRDVPLQKIGLAQRYILDIAKKTKTLSFVATNLLESMLTNLEPTRAEINDITSTLLSGANGLVLAAETAIGKNPIESVRMISGVMQETEKYISNNKKNDIRNCLGSIHSYSLINPHGGVLIQNFIDFNKVEDIKNLPTIDIDEQTLSDVVQIAEGTYSPLKGFMDHDELISVLQDYKLPNGVVWPLPILLQLNKEDINFSQKDLIALRWKKDKKIYAVMKVSGTRKINISDIAKKWFGTEDIRHPGVAYFAKRGNYIISGEVFLGEKPSFFSHSYSLNPRQTRNIFKDYGWQKIVGFHTRNVIHRGHEFIQKQALKSVNADALFISPVVGFKKQGDFSAEAILKSYEVMLNNDYYAPFGTLLGTFNTYSRYSGPREAIFTALCRKNFGCTHFIIGRDHTGVGDYYSPNASQELFHKLGDIGIVPLMFDTAYYCEVCKKTTTDCAHDEKNKKGLSGTEVRRCLLNNIDIEEYLVRKDIAAALRKMYKVCKDDVFKNNKQNK
ncbi:sulfate adenylyltransferase [Candidatus Parcubacteria bacterium]|nr:sulfate adenylyltransferase [Candidatus Parcubacteria bacterium]